MSSRRLSLALVLALALSAAPRAEALCPDWKLGPFATNLSSNGANGTVVCSMLWDPDGAGPLPTRLVIAGSFTQVQGVTAVGIAQYDPSTGAWSDVGGGVSGTVYAMWVYNGELVAAGTIATAGGQPVNKIAAFDGVAWHGLGTGITGTYVLSLTTYNGELVAGGSFGNAGGTTVSNIARWNGASWSALGSGTSGNVSALTTWGTDLVAGGAFATAGGVTVNNVARWDGGSWSAMNTGLVGRTVAAFQPAFGQLYAAVNGSGVRVASWNGTSWSQSAAFTDFYDVNSIMYYNGSLYLGGEGRTGTGNPANGMYRYVGGNTVEAVGGGITDGVVYTLMAFNSELIAAGTFAHAGTLPATRVARWDGASWGSYGGGTKTNITAFALLGSTVIAGGDFHQNIKARSMAHHIVSVNNGTLSNWGTGMNAPVLALKVFKYPGVFGSTEILAGGAFTTAGSQSANRIARWTLSNSVITPPAWAAMGPGFDNTVRAVERFNSNTYAGGDFTLSGATGVNRIARWNETTDVWEALGTGMNGPVHALCAFNGYLYAGGSFTSAGGVSTGGLARWNGTTWSACGGFFLGTVYALTVHNGVLAIGGQYAGINSSPNLAWYDGTSYGTYGTGGTNAPVRALLSAGSTLYVAGDFTSAGNLPVASLASYDGTWHDVGGGADAPIYALTRYHNLVQVGGAFANMDHGAFINTHTWAQWDETGVPQFYQSPSSQTVSDGQAVTLTAVPDTGTTSLTLQWYKDGSPIADGPTGYGSTRSGTNGEVLNITNLRSGDLGTYWLQVSNGCGSGTSGTATLSPTLDAGATRPGATAFTALGPNPARGPARLAFALEREADVRIRVRDIAGRLVDERPLGRLAAGSHAATWDPQAGGATRARPGVYFVELDVEGRSIGVRRLAVLR